MAKSGKENGEEEVSTELDAPNLCLFHITGSNPGRFTILKQPAVLQAYASISFCKELTISPRCLPLLVPHLGDKQVSSDSEKFSINLVDKRAFAIAST
ncbi:unnamed protein product [Microthlaspi erraticum]|uniref:Uncharacterized protein n=1 Tax=Microthlaspi erraticum TaxID=1685480 RepID=A0A6D2KPY9_9BRAS|nr:unnamed protein product [Microthlaspi erraticum]CAA7055158.1 unnamed protein product [Microthlaspi erraticum]CAA7058734.1 unnamed protein product [Microthlaspi erraticum]